ncbi:MAG: LysR family transcriptional regulator [Rhodospirillales bacterium]|nr:LysR family transcriptional regulator [Rhodospirillales bacterium]
MDWDKLRVFHAVAEAGSFTHAGENLNLSQSAVSRQISALEEILHVPLFHRHARGLILTEQGELLHRTAREMFAKLAMTTAKIRESREQPQGALKITTTVAFGSVWLTPRLNEFLKLYPDIEVSLVLADTELDLSMREADVAVRLIPPRQPDLIQLHLMRMRHRSVASPDYIENFGIPETPQELDGHRIVVYGEDASPPVPNLDWLLHVGADMGRPRKPILRLNSTYGIFRAIQSGVGIGMIPDYIAREADELIEILPDLHGPSVDVFFVYPDELRHSMRIAVFRDFLVSRIASEGIKDTT